MITKKGFLWSLWIIISIVGLSHLYRALTNLPMSVGSWIVPIWVSYLAFVVLAYLSYRLYKFLKK